MNLPTPTLGLAGWTLLAGLILGSLAGWRVTSWVNQGHELKAVKAALSQAQAQYQKRIDDLLGQVKTNQEASRVFQNELATLRAQPRDPRPVRLCVSPASPRLPQAPATQSRPDESTPSAGRVSPPDGPDTREGPDISSDLYDFADRCDAISAQLRGLQQSVLTR